MLTNQGSTYRWRKLRAAILMRDRHTCRLLRCPGYHRRPCEPKKRRGYRPPTEPGSSLPTMQPFEGCQTTSSTRPVRSPLVMEQNSLFDDGPVGTPPICVLCGDHVNGCPVPNVGAAIAGG